MKTRYAKELVPIQTGYAKWEEAKKRFAEKILEDFEPEVDVVYSIYADTPKGRELVSTPNTEAQAKEAMLDYWNREGDSYEYELVVNKMQDIF